MISRSSSSPRRSRRTAAWSCSGAICARSTWGRGCARRSRDCAATTAVRRLALVLLALFYVGARRLEHLRYLSGDPLVTRFCGLARLPTRRTVADWLRQFTQETLAPLIALNRDLVTEALARLELPRLTIDVDGIGRPHRGHGGLGLPRLQPASPERPELLPAVRPCRPDRPHPPAEEPARQRPRLQAGDPVPARPHRRPARPLRPARGPGVPHGRGLLPARDSAAAGRPGLRLRDQGRVLELAAAQGDRRRVPSAGTRWPRASPATRPTCHPPVERSPPARGPLPEARPPRDAPELPARSVHPR